VQLLACLDVTESTFPEVIGGYELGRLLGRGGMADVWVARKAVGEKGSKYVAIKLIAEHLASNPEYARMFRAEAELAAALNQANIVQVFEHGEDAGRSYLVMEWVDGLNLLMLEKRLAWVEEQRRFRLVSYIIGQRLHALHYAHRIRAANGHPMGVVHRDVSPQNVLVSNNGEVKLTDFGVAHHNLEETSGRFAKGKLRYMPREQLVERSRLPTVDLFAVGALLHEMLDGKRFRGAYDDEQDLIAAVLSQQVPPLSRRAPAELDQLRRRLLEPNPARRIQTAENALALLQRFPGYGDARHELGKLCSNATGVLEPCVAPQAMASMATDAATEPRRSRGVVGPGAPSARRPPPVPLSTPRGSNGPQVKGSTAQNGRGGSELPPASAWRTGETQLVELHAPVLGAAGDALPPLPRALEPTVPLPNDPPAWSPGAAAHPVLVEVHDTGASYDAVGSSRTDPELARPAVAGDGTATVHDRRAHTPSASTAEEVRRWKRSALAMLGLLLVSTASIPMVWWVADRGNDVQMTTARIGSPTVEPRQAWPWPWPSPFSKPVEDPPAVSAHVAAPADWTMQADDTVVVEVEPEAEAPRPGSSDAADEPQIPSSPRLAARVKPPKRMAKVRVVASPVLKDAQVKVGSSKVLGAGSRSREIAAGKLEIKWRESPDKPWRTRPNRYDFAAGKRWIIHVDRNGPSISEER
jgi:Protein kinase domain